MLGVATALAGCADAGASTAHTSTTKAAAFRVAGASGPVPASYQTEYDQVEGEVSAFAKVAARPSGHASTIIGTELLAANGNIGTGLLRPSAISGVDRELDAYAALGVRGVTVDVSFPLLLMSTPDSSGYLDFYEQVSDQVRRHHMVLSVEENPIFSGTPLTTLSISYAGLTLTSYAAEQRQEAQTIIDDLHPRYLSLLTEPDTYADTLDLDLNSPNNAAEVVATELQGLDHHGTKVGAGTGTWTSPAIDRALLSRTSIDYLDVHVYPLGPQQVSNLSTDVAAARGAHKPLVMDETWLNKPTATAASGPQGAPDALKLKSYSFWEPLDERYVAAMERYVRADGFSYVSFFDGARAFFSYLTWSPSLASGSYASFSQEYNRQVAANMRSGTITGTGLSLYKANTGRAGPGG